MFVKKATRHAFGFHSIANQISYATGLEVTDNESKGTKVEGLTVIPA